MAFTYGKIKSSNFTLAVLFILSIGVYLRFPFACAPQKSFSLLTTFDTNFSSTLGGLDTRQNAPKRSDLPVKPPSLLFRPNAGTRVALEDHLCDNSAHGKSNMTREIDWQVQSECALLQLLVPQAKLTYVRRRMNWAMELFMTNNANKPQVKQEKLQQCWRTLYEGILHRHGVAWKIQQGSETFLHAMKWTNMRINDVTGEVLGLIYPKYEIEESATGAYGSFDLEEAKRGVESMRENGFYIMKRRLPQNMVQNFINKTKLLRYHNHARFDSSLRDGSVNFVKDQNDVPRKIPEALGIMGDPTIVYILQEYFGCSPLNTQTNTWWSVSGSLGSARTQQWHQDFTWIKFVKLFLYLNDVTKENGAHRYTPGSFKNLDPVLSRIKSYSASTRIDDRVMEELYPGKSRYMEGKSGTIILEDTRGFHAGTALKSGYRHLMQWEFAISSFRYSPEEWRTTSLCRNTFGGNILRNLMAFPRVFERYNFKDC